MSFETNYNYYHDVSVFDFIIIIIIIIIIINYYPIITLT